MITLAIHGFCSMLRTPMNPYNTSLAIKRGGEQLRQHHDRFFYLKPLGWFLRTRGDILISEGLEVNDGGIVGPFHSRAAARYFLLKLIYAERPELFSGEQTTNPEPFHNPI